MEITKETIERLWYLQTWSFDFECFTKIYTRKGEDPENQHSLASHMWRKYQECNNNLLRFWKLNDSGNQKSIMNYLNEKEFEAEFQKNMRCE